jgi:hypothetical protein
MTTLRSISVAAAMAASLVLAGDGAIHAMDRGVAVAPANITQTGMVAIQRAGSHHCTGTLLSSRWVLTAEHCMTSYQSYFQGGAPVVFWKDTANHEAIRAATWDTAALYGRWLMTGATSITTPLGHTRYKLLVAARLTNGDVDTSWSSDGFATTSLSGVTSLEGKIIVQDAADGFFVVADSMLAIGRRMTILHYDKTGTLEAASWPDGSGTRTAYNAIPGEPVAALMVGGKLIVAGTDDTGVNPAWVALRYLPGGATDGTFLPFLWGPDYRNGVLLDVIQTPTHLVWLGRVQVATGAELRLVLTDLDGVLVKEIPLPLNAVGTARKLALRSADSTHPLDAVWVVGEGAEATSTQHVLAKLFDIPSLAPAAGWPTTATGPIANGKLRVFGARQDAARRLVVGADWSLRQEEPVLVRFDAGGLPDTTFAQGGTLRSWEPGVRAHAMTMAPDGTFLVAGRDRDPSTTDSLWAAAFSSQTSTISQLKVAYGASTWPVKTVLHHPDPGIDVALIELDTSATPFAGTVQFAGVNPVNADGKSVLCLGYGLHDGHPGGQLREGMFRVAGRRGRSVQLVANPSMIQHGDSGGSCFLELENPDHTTTRYLVGVTSTGYDTMTNVTPFGTGSLQFYVSPADFATWVEQKTGVVMRP